MPLPPVLHDAPAAFAAYEAVRSRLPATAFPESACNLASLAETADRFDGYLLDAYGVLNVGQTAIPGAVARMAALRAMGKRLCVLTNGASYAPARSMAKYRRMGFDFSEHEVISSRGATARRLDLLLPGARWAAISEAGDGFTDLPGQIVDAIDTPAAFDDADGILFLSSSRWTGALHDRLQSALAARPRPLVVANPDLIAPHESGFSQEPGRFCHDLAPLASEVHWIGKPFGAVYDDALARIGLPAHRIAMVGDTLHTDILGGRAAGMGTVLISGHGLFKGQDVAPYIARCGIVPDVICPTT